MNMAPIWSEIPKVDTMTIHFRVIICIDFCESTNEWTFNANVLA